MQKVLKELFDQFVKKNGREPDNLEMILIRQKASAEDIRKRKIVSMFDRTPVDANKPILGGQNIQETDAQILERLNKGNKESMHCILGYAKSKQTDACCASLPKQLPL